MAPLGSEGSQCGERVCPEGGLYSEELALRGCSATNSKRGRLSEDGVKLDEGIGSALHDYLLERIIVRLSFKTLFQAASLSKSWRLRFRSDSFQSEVQRLGAASWKAYTPLYVNRKKNLVGYESCSERWHVLPDHSYLQQDKVEDWCLRAGAGSILCWTSTAPGGRYSDEYHVNVTNPLTRSWRQLPTRPDMQFPDHVHVVCEGTEAYKVILATLRPHIGVQIFHSTNGAWTLDSDSTLNFDSDWGGIAFVDGVLYMMLRTLSTRSEYKLVSFDVEANIWTETPLRFKAIDGNHESRQPIIFCEVRFSEIFVCGSNVMLVVAHTDKFDDVVEDYGSDDGQDLSVSQTVSVLELDLDRGVAVEVSRAPKEMANVAHVCSAAGHGDCIYIGGRLPSTSSIVYNVETREWHWVNSATDRLKTSFTDIHMNQWLWTSITYQPGVNPFLEV